METGRHQPLPRELADSLRDAITAIELEQAASSLAAKDPIHLRDGRLAGSIGAAELWTFDVDDEIGLRAESTAFLVDPNDVSDPVPVTIVGTDDSTVALSTTWYLPDDQRTAILALDASFVMDALRRRLEAAVAQGGEAEMLEAILVPDRGDDVTETPVETVDRTYDIDADAAQAQELAAERAIEPGLRFTWGPPGTGKTTVLARAVELAIEAGYRVLVVAHSNVAVDVAIGRIAASLEFDLVESHQVLRVGPPHSVEFANSQNILVDEVAEIRRPELAAIHQELLDQRRHLVKRLRSATTDEDLARNNVALTTNRESLAAVEQELRLEARAAVDEATVVAATASRLLVDDHLWGWPADVVIIDEASMISVPHVLAIATRGASTLSCFGDFRQLPPVAVAESPRARSWFGTDVFERAGVVEVHDQRLTDRRLTSLHTQFRMGEAIAATVNDLAYDGMLRTGNRARKRGIRLAELEPCPGAEIVIIDSSEIGAYCGTTTTGSRFNLLSAAATLAAAQSVYESGCDDIGIVSPYRAQALLLAAACTGHSAVGASTIHKFQGSERDAIIVDLTDGPPRPGPSMLTGSDLELSRRLLNVAVSRARGKLVLVADRSFVEATHGTSSTTRRLLDIAVNRGAEILDAAEFIESAGTAAGRAESAEPPARWFDTWSEATRAAADFRPSTASIPDERWDGRWFDALRMSAPEVHLQVGVQGTPNVVADRCVVVGSTHLDGPAAVIGGARTSTTVKRIFGEPDA